jgi:hypothetical protein
MFKVVKEVPPLVPIITINSVEKELEKGNKILVYLYDNGASLFIKESSTSVFFYEFNKNSNIHSKSVSIRELLLKQNLNESDLYLFGSLKEFFIYAESQGWDY